MLLEGEFKGLRIGITAINSVITLSGVVPTEAHAGRWFVLPRKHAAWPM